MLSRPFYRFVISSLRGWEVTLLLESNSSPVLNLLKADRPGIQEAFSKQLDS